MNRNFIKWCIFILSQSVIIRYVESSSSNETTSDENRHPRVNGRIVKLYPGYKPEPITCTEEGFRADPVDCSIFYRCIMAKSGKFSVLRFQCGPGTVYDPDTEVCNHPHNTKRSECGANRPYQYLIAPADQVNENDIDSSAHEIPSPITTWKPLNADQISSSFRPSTGSSTPEFQSMTSLGYGSITPVEEIHKQYVTKTEELSTPKASVVSTSYPWSTSISSTNNPKLTITQSNEQYEYTNECYHDGFMGDNRDCRKFYRCVNNQRGGFTKYEFMCSESTIWDDDKQSCNHPWAVRRSRCVRHVWETENKSNTYFTNKNISSEDLISRPTKTTSSTQTYYGDRINVDKTNVESNPNNLDILNNSFLTENEYVPSKIQHKPTQPTSHYLDPLIQTQKPLYESTTKTSTYSTYDPSSKVLEIKCTESGFMGDPNDCRKFYRCVQNGKDSYIRHEFSCGEGTAWDERAESCNHAWMVKECGVKLLHDMSTTRKSNIEEKRTTTDPNIATQENGYNIGRESSSLPVTTVTLLNLPDKGENTEMCNAAGYKGSITDCRKFYRCIENDNGGFTKLEYICDEGTVWDSNIEACNHQAVVKKCVLNANTASKLTTPSTESTIITTISFIQSTIQSSNIGYNDEVQDVNYYKELTPNKELTNENNKCREDGFMADQYNCRKFFRCVENGNNSFIRFEYSCGDGTAWDAKINACNHLRAVPTCGNDYNSESTSLKYPPSDSYENVNNYTTIKNKNDENTLRTESTTATTSKIELTSDNNELNVCSRSGFIGDISDCKKFYRCVLNSDGSYTKHEFSCGEGTVWDPEIEACNHPAAVKRCGGSLEEQKDVSTSAPRPLTTIHSVNDELDNGYIQSLDEAESPENNTSQLSSENPPFFDKTQECNKVGFLADRNDCKKFYRCVENGQGGLNRFEFSCGDGTAWDQKVEACNHISLVKECESMGNEISASTVTSLQPETSVHSTVANNLQHDEATATVKPSKQKDDCIAEGFYGNKNDCKKFYRCVSDQQGGFIQYEFSCGDGTIWDQNIQSCNHEYSDNLNCTVKSTTDSKPPGTVIEPAINQESQDHTALNEISTTEKYVDESHNKDNTCSSEGFYPNLEDCKKFIRCVNDGKGKFIRYDFTCGEGTIWVQDIQACDHENDNSTCSTGVSTNTEAHIVTTQSTQTVTLSTIQNTTTGGNIDSTKYPVTSQNVSKDDECHSEGYFANSNDCRRFYRCVVDDHGTFVKYDYICGEGTAWDLDTQSCNHIGNIKRCTGAQDSQTTTLETNVVQSQTTETIKTTIPPTTNALQPQATEIIKTTSIAQPETTENIKTTVTLTTNKEQPQTTENIKTTIQPTSTPVVTPMQGDHSTVDNCQAEGYFGNKEDCQKFYRCVDNGQGSYTKYDYICGEGTLWDQDILACNHPQDVKNPSCKEGTKPSPSIGSTQSSIQSTESTSSSSQLTPTSTTSKHTTVSASENSSQGTSNCSSSENVKNENLTCSKAGYFPNPNNCKKFYRCVDWDGDGQRFSIFHFECGEGTIWDPALDTCNYEDSVYPPRNCKGLQTQNDISSTSTVSTEENTPSSVTSEITTQTTQTTQITSTESTTQQITSTESTTQQITSTESTTQQGTSTESTTQQISTTESTTQQTASTESSTSQITSTESTTQQITTTESTTQQITSTESTTQQITSTDTTTQQVSSTESTTQQVISTETTTQQQSSTDTTTTQPTTTITEQSTTPTTEITKTTTDQTTSEATSTTTDQPTTSEKTATDSTTITEQATSTTNEQSTTEASKPSTTGQSTTMEETSSTTVQQSTELSTESQSSTTTTENSTASTTTESGQETTSTESSPPNKCPDTESDQYLYACPSSFKRHPKYCNLFYQCLEDNDTHELKIAVFNCPNGTIYDESKVQCVEERNAQKKCEGAIAQKRRFKRLNVNNKEIITASKNTYRCPGVGHFPFEKNEECSPALLRCDMSKSGKLRGFVYRCPENQVYWLVSRKCEPISKMAHCKHSTSQWAKRYEIPIERKNVAQ